MKQWLGGGVNTLIFKFPNFNYETSELSCVYIVPPQASAEGILDASAVQFCARKVSAVSGDARKALDICRYKIQFVLLVVCAG